MYARRGSAGFTLIEVLVSAGLVSLVLALALKGFTEAKKIADITKAKVMAEQEASLGAQKLAKLMRRAHIVYFDARPLKKIDADIPTLGNFSATHREAAAPGYLTGATALPDLGDPDLFLAPTTGELYRDSIRAGFGAAIKRSKFFVRTLLDTTAAEDVASPAGEEGLRLKTGERLMPGNTALAEPFDRFFTSPLLYCAEANFNTGVGAGGVRLDANLPMTWTFHLVYLAPMRFDKNRDAGDALFPVQEADAKKSPNHTRDLGPGGWVRATVPYELRLLTIPDVQALVNRGNAAASTATPLPIPNHTGLVWGRRIDQASVVPFPFDVVSDNVNYDPVPLDIGSDSFNLLASASDHFGAPSYTRVAGTAGAAGSIHGNWDNLGNDPPSQAALARRQKWNGTAFVDPDPITDTMLAKYVDPDNVHGTFVRLANDWDLVNEGEAQPRPYVNAYGGPQKYNPSWWNAANTMNKVSPPRRALVSVATRFRFSRQHPFAFSTESIEVDLDSLARFQNMDHRKRR